MSDVLHTHTKAMFQSAEDVHQCCGEGMWFVAHTTTWNDEKPDFDNHYESLDDYWVCGVCHAEKPSRRYRDWFGRGDTDVEVHEHIENHGEPLKIMFNDYMACLIYPDSVLVFGYDGNEYMQSFGFQASPTDIHPLNLRIREEIVLISDEEE